MLSETKCDCGTLLSPVYKIKTTRIAYEINHLDQNTHARYDSTMLYNSKVEVEVSVSEAQKKTKETEINVLVKYRCPCGHEVQ